MLIGDLTPLRREFRFFGEICEGRSPLYAALSARVAEADAILAFVRTSQPGQSPANLLFAAVHDLLLGGAEHELAGFYPSMGGWRDPRDAYPVFTDFCSTFEDAIRDRVTSRRVQTNEVGRCGLLLPAFALAWERFDRKDLHLIEIGASAGLNLLFDHYRYVYTFEEADRAHVCGPESAAVVRTAVRAGAYCPLPRTVPAVAGRVGIDLAPVDVMDDEAVRWVQAMIWADQVPRIELFREAVALARRFAPELVTADGGDALPDVIGSVPVDALPCVFHSHAIYQMDKEWRLRFAELLDELGARHRFAYVSLEWLGGDPGPRLHLTLHDEGRKQERYLAECDHHGAWMRWRWSGRVTRDAETT